MAGQRPLLERAAAGDREAFARLFEDQVEGVYRYLLAWSGDRAEAAELTGQVFRDALGWLPATAGGEVEAGAWLIAMARDAVAQRRGSG
jgi:RNA polymerase sigma-70 factor, ECF subfamily